MQQLKETLQRRIGLWGLSANIVNVVIGAGIFVLPAIVAAGLGAAGVLAYVFCGILVALVMLCFAEVGSKVTASGGVYAYIETAFGRPAGFVAAVTFLLSTSSADAAVSNAIVNILAVMMPVFQNEVVKIIFFVLLFGGLAYVNILGVKGGVRFVEIITVVKVLPLLLVIGAGFFKMSADNLTWDTFPAMTDLGTTSLILFFAFQGAESGLSVSGEVKNPQKTIPRAILVSIFVVLVLYIIIQSVAQGVLGSELGTFTENPLAETARRSIGPIGFTILTLGAAVSMFGYLSSEILSIPRVLYAASEDKVFPIKALSRVHKKFATPFVSIIVYAAMGLLLASAGGFKQLAVLSSATILLIYLGVCLATMKLKNYQPAISLGKTFKIPGGPVIPVLACLVILWFLSNLAMQEIIGISGFIVFLTVVYFVIEYFKKKPN